MKVLRFLRAIWSFLGIVGPRLDALRDDVAALVQSMRNLAADLQAVRDHLAAARARNARYDAALADAIEASNGGVSSAALLAVLREESGSTGDRSG